MISLNKVLIFRMQTSVFAIFLILTMSLSPRLFCQSLPSRSLTPISQYGIFDHVSDRFGNEYQLLNLSLNSSKPLGGGSYSINTVPTNTCDAGHFILYFEAGSYFDLNSTAANLLCEVFRNISGFINSPLTTTGVKLNIYCGNNPNSIPGAVLAAASSFYLYPYNPVNPNQGFLFNQIQKGIISGTDPFSNLPISVFSGASNFYSGYVTVNPTASWHLNIATSTISPTSNDLYSTMLHEVTHALGFASLISNTGVSQLGVNNNYFSVYDKFLHNAAGLPLLGTAASICGSNNYSFQALATAISPSACSGGGSDLTTCSVAAQYSSTSVTSKVYTPFCWEQGSSLSHFEDICSTPPSFTTSCTASPANNNLYYVMSNANSTGDCYVKRHLTPEERFVLCDLGYSVSNTYTSSAAAANFTYSGSTCPGKDIWGMHDGFANNAFTYTTNTTSFSVALSTLTSNDTPSITVIVSCPEVIFNSSATVSISGSNLLVNAPAGAGLVVLKYLPTTTTGEFGNPTYVYVFFNPQGCEISNACNMVQNGGFENLDASSPEPCGAIYQGTPYGPRMSCWLVSYGTPDVYTRSCTMASPQCNLGTNTWGSNPPIDSHNGAPNNRVVGFSDGEEFKNCLSAPLVPGTAYQLSFWVYNSSAPMYNPSATPLVISAAVDESANNVWMGGNNYYPDYLPVISEFTVYLDVWTQVTNTFVFNPTNPVNHNVLFLGIDYLKTLALGVINPNGTLTNTYCFYDDVTLMPISNPNPNFYIPAGSNCSNTSFTNLAQYTNFTGTFSGPGVSNPSAGVYHFNQFLSLPTGTYPVAFTYTNNGCEYTISQNVILSPPNFTVSTSGSPIYCTNLSTIQPAVTLSASSTQTSGINYLWQPGNLSGPTPTTIPLSSGIYTVYASGNCVTTATLAVSVSNSCCTSSVTALSAAALASGNITGPLAINGNINLTSGQALNFLGGEFIIAPNVQIIVNGGASLLIQNSHLHACSTNMWAGIVVKDGGSVSLDFESYDNLIEDAVTAVEIRDHTTSNLSAILQANRTTFNKNLVGIKVSNYIRSSSTYPFSIKNCVFTSRDFTYTPTVWAQTSSTLASGLRYAASGATLNVSSPYLLQSAPVASLLVPYSGNTSKTGIQLTNVGLTSGSNFYGIAIGFTDTPQSFNLFDSQNEGILAENTNLYCLNAVFQETREYGSMGLFWMQYEPGAGIRHRVTSLMNTKLGLSAPNTDFGNRFWNCHTGINATNPYRFELENAIMRSTQVNTFVPINPPPALQPPNALGGYGQGGFGILMGTNRINSYIRYNEFTNLNTGISISAIAGTYTVGTSTPQNGIYGYKLAIVQNSFSPLLPSSTATTIGTSYMSRAISIDSPNGALWNVGTDPTDPGSIGIIIGSNSIKRVYDGVILNGISSAFRNTVDKNTITLDDDNIFNTVQRGITVENVAGMHTSSSNTLSSVGTGTSAQTSLVYCIQNGGLASPLVICNTLSNAYQGFEFSSNNLTSKWRGNEMSNLQRGLLLSYSSQMGQQGTNSQSCQNKWLGSTWSSPNFATYLITSSNASFSPMYIKPGNTTPPNNSGSVINSQWYIPSVSIFTASGGDYSCVSSPNSIPVPVVSPGSFDNDTYFYIAATNLYRTLALNDSIRLSSSTYTAFYNSLSGSSIDLFWKAEQELYDNDHSTASSYLSSITTTNSVEYNYKTYYTVYANYLGNGNTMSQNDSADLFTLALMCPGKDGACIHQARALYNAVYKFPQRYNDNCEGGERKANITNSITSNLKWDVRLFPNPAENRITINTPIKTEILNIKISDVSGRLVLTQNVKTEDFIANLDLGLLNGAYLVTITNKNNETTTKKLLIAK